MVQESSQHLDASKTLDDDVRLANRREQLDLFMRNALSNSTQNVTALLNQFDSEDAVMTQ